jgi:hypothetical protein
MGSRHRAAALGLLTLAVLCGLLLSSAAAHTRAVAPPLVSVDSVPLTDGRPAAPAPAAGAIDVVLLLTAAALLLLGRWPATTVRVLLALLILTGGIEAAVHSVHHLGSPQGAKSCTVSSVTQHIPGETSPEIPTGVPAGHSRRHVTPETDYHAAPLALHLDRGRAPPVPLA